MAADLMKSIDELSDDEKGALVERVFTTEFLDESDAATERAKEVRSAVAEHSEQEFWTRDDLVAALNGGEHTRLMMHVALSLAGKNITRCVKRLATAGCAYCDEWKYEDQDFGIPADRELTDEEIAAVDDRVKAAIRAHITMCPKHPMRALEHRLAVAESERELDTPGGY